MQEYSKQQCGYNSTYTLPINQGELATNSGLIAAGGSTNGVSDKDVQLVTLFPQFLKLAPELRLLVWTHTWPGTRLIQCLTYDGTRRLGDALILCLLSPQVDDDDSTIRYVDDLSVHCRLPVSLQVCRESRMHTLTQYRRMEHKNSKLGSFYFNPYRDVLLADAIDEPSYVEHIIECYGEQLNGIETVLVSERQWGMRPDLDDCLEPFGGVKNIVWERSDSEEGDKAMRVAWQWRGQRREM